MATTLPSPTATTVDVSFPVTGMTCASCVNRVEKAIGKVAGGRTSSGQPRHRAGDRWL
jgi:cation transport ATPase